MTIHASTCRWERTTPGQCEYRETHHYCPHPEHACNCGGPELDVAPSTPSTDTPQKCPNPHCDRGMIKGTGVGCSICKGILFYTRHSSECESLYRRNGVQGKCDCGLSAAIVGLTGSSNTDRGQGQSLDAPLPAQIVSATPAASSNPAPTDTPELDELITELEIAVVNAAGARQECGHAESERRRSGLPAARSALRSEYSRQREELSNQIAGEQENSQYLETVVASLRAEVLTPEEAQEIISHMEHGSLCAPPKECHCGLWRLQTRLRRISGYTSEGITP